MNDRIYRILKSLPKDAIIGIMWNALDTMQGYNGHGRNEVIARAMGADIPEHYDDDESDICDVIFPETKGIKKRGKSSPLF